MLIFVAALAPGLFWIGFLLRMDKYEKEPKGKIVLGFFAGILSALVVILVGVWIPVDEFLSSVVVAPVSEELAKFLLTYLFFYASKDFNEPLDGMIYAGVVALGFASFENFFYVWQAAAEGAETFGAVSILRAFLSVPGHMLFSGFWGYALSVKKFGPKGMNPIGMAFYIFLAMLVHGLFNYVAVSSELLYIPIFALNIGLMVYFLWRIRQLQDQSPFKNSQMTGK